ncbi:protein-L-isoaspartate(D-aspartate) O-methyltransferase [Snodgrassella sp. CFCC 13594]|uniref:protein-L-isoaspartate(D-aspartate) O-methyltransferase n=1 Tax=Snodgrassella sp. CFCC 13594 TaxID=1775559 RepID=UPI00082F24E9|nr:protein-L-isoaspartate(D-aspartate) O-methyltransferase [Snodgrassella sp. CFCC 13594]
MTNKGHGLWAGYDLRRQRMVQRLVQMGIHRSEVLDAMSVVPRHVFVEEALRSRAYDDMSLPLGLGQTISQPYTVAVMTQLLLGQEPLSARQKVLEIGTGCGYQTAVLQALGVPEIYSIERLRPLHDRAKSNLRAIRLLGHARLVCGDGYLGLPAEAPFDGILVTAAPTQIPVPLLQQLAIGGRMVLPLDNGQAQYLWVIDKTATGFQETCVQEALFVPLVNGT